LIFTIGPGLHSIRTVWTRRIRSVGAASFNIAFTTFLGRWLSTTQDGKLPQVFAGRDCTSNSRVQMQPTCTGGCTNLKMRAARGGRMHERLWLLSVRSLPGPPSEPTRPVRHQRPLSGLIPCPSRTGLGFVRGAAAASVDGGGGVPADESSTVGPRR
jgi:hypothetical protein